LLLDDEPIELDTSFKSTAFEIGFTPNNPPTGPDGF
jgi:hypothetical protein